MSKTIAPTLRRWLGDEMVTVECLPQARREFEALLAVYRAAERVFWKANDENWASLMRALDRARAAKGGR